MIIALTNLDISIFFVFSSKNYNDSPSEPVRRFVFEKEFM